MSAVKNHFSSHPSHLVACGITGLLVVAAIVFTLPVLAILGAVFCGAMMIGMVWMMFSMAHKGSH
jgi:hypothetical protein